MSELDIDFDDLRLNRDTFLRHLDGIVYGADPRQGYFRDQHFFHPEMRFELSFPNDWKTMNMRQAVVAQQPNGEAVVTLTLAAQQDAESAARALADQGAKPVREWRDRIGGERAVSYYWTADLQGTPAAGLAAFVEHEGNVFRMLGLHHRGELRPLPRRSRELARRASTGWRIDASSPSSRCGCASSAWSGR